MSLVTLFTCFSTKSIFIMWFTLVTTHRCKLHGQCKNGTCLCVTGWNGRHCTIQVRSLLFFILLMELLNTIVPREKSPKSHGVCFSPIVFIIPHLRDVQASVVQTESVEATFMVRKQQDKDKDKH